MDDYRETETFLQGENVIEMLLARQNAGTNTFLRVALVFSLQMKDCSNCSMVAIVTLGVESYMLIWGAEDSHFHRKRCY